MAFAIVDRFETLFLHCKIESENIGDFCITNIFGFQHLSILKIKFHKKTVYSKFFFKKFPKQNSQIPTGRREWEIGGLDFDCHFEDDLKVEGSKVNLTLSRCFPDMFTCTSGDCIKLRFLVYSKKVVIYNLSKKLLFLQYL